MFEKMEWKDIYEQWRMGCYYFPDALTSALTAETVFVEYKKDGYIYGYDWLEISEAQKRKQLINENPVEFLYFTKPTNKGTIHTAQMLIEAQNEEETAAIWIAATANELSEHRYGSGIGRCADVLYMSACDFLSTRFYLWHHAMKKLVPDILIPSSVLENMVCEDVEPVLGLIQMNAALLKSTWRILRYCSLKDGELPRFDCSVRRESL